MQGKERKKIDDWKIKKKERKKERKTKNEKCKRKNK